MAKLLTHATGNVLYDNLSNLKHSLGYDFLRPSTNPNLAERANENERKVERFVEILLRRRRGDGLAGSPLIEEWTFLVLNLYFAQDPLKPIDLLPFALMPGTREFRALCRDCTNPTIRYRFDQIATLGPRALRAEVGGVSRLLNGVFRSASFVLRARRSFDFGAFLQSGGLLLVERGEVSEDVMRSILGAIVLLVVDHAKQRPTPYPTIRIVIDEANNANLVGSHELKGIAETNKNGLYWEFLVQPLNFPGNTTDEVLQNCLQHEWFCCPNYDLARKAASDILTGLGPSEQSRAERMTELTDWVVGLDPGYRWVREGGKSDWGYVPLIENPWPDWPGLRDAKREEFIQCIYQRPEYQTGESVAATSSDSSSSSPPPPPKSRKPFSPAAKWKRAGRKPADGSTVTPARNESASSEPSKEPTGDTP